MSYAPGCQEPSKLGRVVLRRMVKAFDFWELLAGMSLFLFAMAQLEAALKALGGRSLSLYLRRATENRFKAVFGGLLSTALLQSSSLVGLMVLAFVGAGLLSLPSALGIVFGSNLGTTLTGWVVATLGFKVEVFSLAFPLIAFGGFLLLFSKGRMPKVGRGIMGLGLLLLGLQFMKSSAASLQGLIDISELAGLPPFAYLIFGVVVAAVIQSSSATIMLTLAALDAQIIDLPSAAAIAIGADLGTTTTVLFGAIGGSVPKKQVAAGHVLFNVVTDIIALILRLPLLSIVTKLGVTDPLYSLVAFHSLFNLLGLLLFLPFTAPFARLLERLLRDEEVNEARYLTEVSPGPGQASLHAVENEASALIARVLSLNMAAFEPPLETPAGQFPVPHKRGVDEQSSASFTELYNRTKRLEGEILEFVIQLQTGALEETESARLSQLRLAVREAMHSAKAIKDIVHNLKELRDGLNLASARYARRFRSAMEDFFARLFLLRQEGEPQLFFEELVDLLAEAQRQHRRIHEEIYADVRSGRVDQSEVSSLLNIAAELLNSRKGLVRALANYYLSETQAADIAKLPIS